MNYVDLHSHTTASDGAYTPADLVLLAHQRGLRVLGITDHDTFAGITEALIQAARYNLTVIPGVEISSELHGNEVHVLGYYMHGYDNPELLSILEQLRANRLDRAEQIVAKLREIGLPLDYARVLEIAAGGSVGRPHIARAMIERGYVSTSAEAFERYIGNGKPAYVARLRMSPEEAVMLITRTGGIASIAHPLSKGAAEMMYQIDLETLLPELAQAGLVGLETYYTGYSEEDITRLLAYCHRFGLQPTGGSDFHGGGTLAHSDLGAIHVPFNVVENLQSIAAARRTPE